MKRFIVQSAVVVIFFALNMFAEVADRIVAVVGNDIILYSEVEEMVQSYLINQKSKPTQEQLKQLRKQVLEQLINNKILFYQAEKDSIDITREQIEQAVDSRIDELIKYFGSESQLKQSLQAEGMTLRDLRKKYFDEAKAMLITQKIMMEKTKNITVSALEVKKFYEQYKDSLPEQPASFKLAYLYLKAEDKFPDYVKRYSQHTATVDNGGDLGWVNKSDILPAIAEVLDTLSLFEISMPVVTPLGFHLIQVTDIDTIKKLYKIRHILMKYNSDDSSGVYQKLLLVRNELVINANVLKEKYHLIDSLRNAIIVGKDSFETVVREYSEDPVTKEKGGNAGWRNVSDFKMLFPDKFDIIKNLKPGDVSPILRSHEGFYVLKILDFQEKRKLTLENDWTIIEKYALEDKKRAVFDRWLKRISKHYYIEIKDAY